MEELLMIYIQLIETKYKGKRRESRKDEKCCWNWIPSLFFISAVSTKDKNIIDNFDLVLKINFLNFISKFESENAPITQFGINLEPHKDLKQLKLTMAFTQ
jgi:hypothetical protein